MPSELGVCMSRAALQRVTCFFKILLIPGKEQNKTQLSPIFTIVEFLKVTYL